MLTCTPGGRVFSIACISAFTEAATCIVLLERCRLILISTAGWPLAVTMVKCGSNAGVTVAKSPT